MVLIRMDRLRTALMVIAGAAVAVMGGTAVASRALRPPAFHGTPYDPPTMAPAVTLTGVDGKPVRLADFRGRPVLLYFGYTHCPDVCPLTLARVLAALKAAGENGRDARVLFITVDPANDTPAALADYARRQGAQVVPMTGDSATLARVQAAYGAYVVPTPAGAHGDMGHSSSVYGIDRKGRLRVLMSEMRTGDDIRDDVRTLVGL
jgi:protein SCO1/2